MSNAGLVAGLAIYLLGAAPAGYLSWHCNTTHGYSIPAKLLFGAFASLMSWGYLGTYFWYKSGTCDIDSGKCRANVPAIDGFYKAIEKNEAQRAKQILKHGNIYQRSSSPY